MHCLPFLALFLSLVLPMTALAQQSVDDALLAAIQAEAETITTIASDFTQEKHLALFDEVMISQGKFAFAKPAALRWEYTTPFKSGFLIKDGSGVEWDEASGDTRPFTVKSNPAMGMVADQIMAWTGFNIEWLKERYDIKQLAEAPITLELRPKSETARSFIQKLVVRFGQDKRTMNQIELHEADGDFTRIIFTNQAVNAPLPAETFTEAQ